MSLRIPRPIVATPTRRYYAAHADTGAAKKRFVQAKCYLHDKKIKEDDEAFNRNQPARFKKMFMDLPAYEKWFTLIPVDRHEEESKRVKAGRPFSKKKLELLLDVKEKRVLNMDYWGQFGETTVPLELTRTDQFGRGTFERFEGPLSMLLEHINSAKDSLTQLYLAQHSLLDLPGTLRDDLPTPTLIQNIGKGDIYASSLWMGTRKTVTPLHRDPNPNLFVQLAGKKTVRMFRPEVGRKLYEDVRAKLGKSPGMANMRGEEMMQEEEMKALEHVVWNFDKSGDPNNKGVEVELKKGDGMYIPLGWWHAVRGKGSGPVVSVSCSASMLDEYANGCLQVNWWFR